MREIAIHEDIHTAIARHSRNQKGGAGPPGTALRRGPRGSTWRQGRAGVDRNGGRHLPRVDGGRAGGKRGEDRRVIGRETDDGGGGGHPVQAGDRVAVRVRDRQGGSLTHEHVQDRGRNLVGEG